MSLPRFREGDEVHIALYPVLRVGGECDRTYDARGRSLTMTIHRPDGTSDQVPVTAEASDDPARAASVIRYTLPAGATTGLRGVWVVTVRDNDSGLTFGTYRFEVVLTTSEVGRC